MQIDTSPVATATPKMAVARAAALAPANPSGQDLAVAAGRPRQRFEAAVAARYGSQGAGTTPGTGVDRRG